MRLLSGLALAGAILLLPAFSQSGFAQQAAGQKLTFDSDTVVWMMSVKPDKTADFEAVIAALKDALGKSARPEAKQQAAGWRVVKAAKPQPDGTVVYSHIISPVVPGADYRVLQTIYEVVPDPTEQRALYDKYVGAVMATLMQVPFTTVADLSK
ncbi:MAG: hypothetical protein ABL993_01645 [Vicinamibacterales bacterium]